ncbi:MAG: biotin synthase BioB [Desulfonatronovibrionaceae bacterium]
MNYFYDLAEQICRGRVLSSHEAQRLLELPYTRTSELFPGTDLIRYSHFGKKVSICAITNAKSGRCSEDCAFCAQSGHHLSMVDEYPLKKAEELADLGKMAEGSGIRRFSMVTSGKGLTPEEIKEIGRAALEISSGRIRVCASLGVMEPQDLSFLKKSGVLRYHHNLETSPGFFPEICTTHNFSSRVDTVAAARKAGLSVCSGGVFGLGETDAQIVQLALILRDLKVDAVPLNFLIPVPGTPLENLSQLTPLRCLKIICLFRYLLPDREIIVCGGRMHNLRELHSMIFLAGASGVMTGDYLTRKGRSLGEDLELIRDLGLEPAL